MPQISRPISLVVMLVASLVVLTAGPARATAASLTITPATGLIDGQTVHLVAGGLAANSLAGVEQCVTGHLLAGCDSGSFTSAQTSGLGGFSLDFTVQTILHTPDGTFDCRTADCVLGTNTTFDAVGAAFTAIAFNPTGPLLLPPVVHATPATNLIDHQTVTVDGTGFRPNGFAQVVQCTGGAILTSDCRGLSLSGGPISPTGTFSATTSVRTRFVTVGGTTVDCRSAVHACELVVGPFDASVPALNGVVAAISFDPLAAAPPPPAIVVTPSTSLIDGQIVHITGSGYPIGAMVVLQQCANTTTIGSCAGGLFATASSAGTFAVDAPLRARLWAGQLIDCRDAATTCTMHAIDFEDFESQAQVPLAFTADGPLLPPPTATATPNTGLLDGDHISLSGSNFLFTPGPLPVTSTPASSWPTRSLRSTTAPTKPSALRPATDPSSLVLVSECTNGSFSDTGASCSSNGLASVDTAGHLIGDVQVWATFTTFTGTKVDCRTAPTQCELRVGWGDPSTSAIADLSFDPNGALLPLPSLTASPNTRLTDGTQMHVVGDGFVPNTSVILQQCATGPGDAPNFPCDQAHFEPQWATTDDTGHLDTVTTAYATLKYDLNFQPDGTFTSSTFDCTAAADLCHVMVYDFGPSGRWPTAGLSYGSAVTPTTISPASVHPAKATAPVATTTHPEFTG